MFLVFLADCYQKAEKKSPPNNGQDEHHDKDAQGTHVLITLSVSVLSTIMRLTATKTKMARAH